MSLANPALAGGFFTTEPPGKPQISTNLLKFWKLGFLVAPHESQSCFPGSSDGKESACNTGAGFDPWVRKSPCRREWQPTPVFLPGESHEQKCLAGFSPWSFKEFDKAEQLTLSLSGH